MDLVKHFMNDFKPSYLRNNRRGGQKNIRCFPACSHDGHKCAGFCGQAVKLDVTSTNTTSNIVAVAEFVQLQTNVPQTKTTAGAKKAAKKKATKKANLLHFLMATSIVDAFCQFHRLDHAFYHQV